MMDTIVINKDTPDDELVTVMQFVLTRMIDRIGMGATVGMLFGTAVLMAVDDAEINDR